MDAKEMKQAQETVHEIVSGIEDSRSRPNSINYTYDFAYVPLKRVGSVVEGEGREANDGESENEGQGEALPE